MFKRIFRCSGFALFMFLLLQTMVFGSDFSKFGGVLNNLFLDQSLSVEKSQKEDDVSVIIPAMTMKYKGVHYSNKELSTPFIKKDNVIYIPVSQEFYSNVSTYGGEIRLESLDEVYPNIEEDGFYGEMVTAEIISKEFIVNGISYNESSPTLRYNNTLYLPVSTVYNGSKKLPILMYHHLSDDPDDWGNSCVSSEKFRNDMVALKNAGYTGVLPDEVIASIDGSSRLPDNPIMITFDDGYSSNYRLAYPILQDIGMKAVFNIVGSSRGMTPGVLPHFTWEQAREMSSSGFISIQSHTHNLHFETDVGKGRVTGIGKKGSESLVTYKERITKDLQRSKLDIESKVGNDCVLFAYPYGATNKHSDALLKDIGFKMSVTTMDGIASIDEGLMSLPRINVSQDMNSKKIIQRLQKN